MIAVISHCIPEGGDNHRSTLFKATPHKELQHEEKSGKIKA